MKKLLSLAGVLAAVAALSVVAVAQQTPQHHQQQQHHQAQHPQALRHIGGQHMGPWAADSAYTRMFHQANVTTVSGKVTSLERFEPQRGAQPGIRLTLKSGNDKTQVDLGPEWFLQHQSARISVGDDVTVQGARIGGAGEGQPQGQQPQGQPQGQPQEQPQGQQPQGQQPQRGQQQAAQAEILMAQTVTLGGNTQFVLRTDDGLPVWDGVRPRQQPTARR